VETPRPASPRGPLLAVFSAVVMRHRSHRSPIFASAVVLCAAAGAVAATFAAGPAHPHAYALNSMLVYRCEIGAVIFAVLYLGLVLVRLAYHGRTPTRIGAGGADLPDLDLLTGALADSQAAATLLAQVPRDVADQVAALEQRVADLESKATGGTADGR
jgi:hypothetical protein